MRSGRPCFDSEWTVRSFSSLMSSRSRTAACRSPSPPAAATCGLRHGWGPLVFDEGRVLMLCLAARSEFLANSARPWATITSLSHLISRISWA